MKRIIFFLIIAIVFPLGLDAQVGGQNVYEFLNLPGNARSTALGGSLISAYDGDVVLGFEAPSLINEEMDGALAFNHAIYVAGIQQGYAGYAKHFEKLKGSMHFGFQYMTYGSFDATDPAGNINGSFKAGDYVIGAGYGRSLSPRWRVGISTKLAFSKLESYNSMGLLADISGSYVDTAKNVVLTLAFKNAGFQLKPYVKGNREPLPFDVQFGVSKRLKYLPFRFSVIAHHLHQWDVRFDDPNAVTEGGLFAPVEDEGGGFGEVVDNFFRHMIFSGELLAGKNDVFRLRLGYNHLRRAELVANNATGLSGFSMGMGITIKGFAIEYGRGFYHIGGGINHFGLSTNLSRFKR